MTSIGELTTAFTAPASCASSTGIHIVGCGRDCVWWAEGPLDARECYPSDYEPDLGHYYSPGVCPSGYTPACTSKHSLGRVTETVQTCCPTALGYRYGCVDPIHPWHSSLGCTVTFSEASSTLNFPTVTSVRDGRTVVTSTARTEVGIGAYGVEIRFQATDFVEGTTTESDLDSSPTSTSVPTIDDTTTAATDLTSSPPFTTDNASNSPSNITSNDDSDSSGLSVAASVGIGVGAAVGTLMLLGLGLFLVWRRMKRRRQDPEPRLLGADHAGNHPSAPVPDSKSAGGFGWYSPAQQAPYQAQAHELSVVGPAPPAYKSAGGDWRPPPQQTPQAHELSVVLGPAELSQAQQRAPHYELSVAGPTELPGRAVTHELGG